jgi:hypothetical protein
MKSLPLATAERVIAIAPKTLLPPVAQLHGVGEIGAAYALDSRERVLEAQLSVAVPRARLTVTRAGDRRVSKVSLGSRRYRSPAPPTITSRAAAADEVVRARASEERVVAAAPKHVAASGVVHLDRVRAGARGSLDEIEVSVPMSAPVAMPVRRLTLTAAAAES